MRNAIDWTYRIHTPSLRRILGLPERMPMELAKTYHTVRIPLDNPRGSALPGVWTVILKATAQVRKQQGNSSAHRLFVVCPCGREIPAGRLAQHRGTCKVPIDPEPAPHPLPYGIVLMQNGCDETESINHAFATMDEAREHADSMNRAKEGYWMDEDGAPVNTGTWVPFRHID